MSPFSSLYLSSLGLDCSKTSTLSTLIKPAYRLFSCPPLSVKHDPCHLFLLQSSIFCCLNLPCSKLDNFFFSSPVILLALEPSLLIEPCIDILVAWLGLFHFLREYVVCAP